MVKIFLRENESEVKIFYEKMTLKIRCFTRI